MKPFPRLLREYLVILVGSVIYALATVCFIFPQGILLGGTGGVSIILTGFLKSSPGQIITVINLCLILLALLILGKSMALKTLVGSLFTTLFITGFEMLLASHMPLFSSLLLSAAAGAFLIALASAMMFFVGSSSGGTDIIALIIQKFSRLKIGRALLTSDVLIVIVGSFFGGWRIAIASAVGFLVKVLGIDAILAVISKKKKRT